MKNPIPSFYVHSAYGVFIGLTVDFFGPLSLYGIIKGTSWIINR